MLLVDLVQAVLDPICFRLVDPTVISKEWKLSPYVTYPHGSHRAFTSSWHNFEGNRTIFVQMQPLLNQDSSWEGILRVPHFRTQWQTGKGILLWKQRYLLEQTVKWQQWYHQPDPYASSHVGFGPWIKGNWMHCSPCSPPQLLDGNECSSTTSAQQAGQVYLDLWTCTGSWKVGVRINWVTYKRSIPLRAQKCSECT